MPRPRPELAHDVVGSIAVIPIAVVFAGVSGGIVLVTERHPPFTLRA